MRRSELKNVVLELAKERGCILISSIMKELNYWEDISRQGTLYEVIYELSRKGKITYTNGVDGYIRSQSNHYQ